jgi:hypothetical protein
LKIDKTKNTKRNDVMYFKFSAMFHLGLPAFTALIPVAVAHFSALFMPIWSTVFNRGKNLGLVKTCSGAILPSPVFYLAFLPDKEGPANLADIISRTKCSVVGSPPPRYLAGRVAKHASWVADLRNVFNDLLSALSASISSWANPNKGIFKFINTVTSRRTKFMFSPVWVLGAEHFPAFSASNSAIRRSAPPRTKIKPILIDIVLGLERLFAIITDTVKALSLLSSATTATGRPVNYWDSAAYANIVKPSVIVVFHRLQVYSQRGVLARRILQGAIL